MSKNWSKRDALTKECYDALELLQDALWGDELYRLADSYRKLAESTYLWHDDQVNRLVEQHGVRSDFGGTD